MSKDEKHSGPQSWTKDDLRRSLERAMTRLTDGEREKVFWSMKIYHDFDEDVWEMAQDILDEMPAETFDSDKFLDIFFARVELMDEEPTDLGGVM